MASLELNYCVEHIIGALILLAYLLVVLLEPCYVSNVRDHVHNRRRLLEPSVMIIIIQYTYEINVKVSISPFNKKKMAHHG